MSSEQTAAEKLVQERKLEEAVSRRVVDRAIQVRVDNGPQGTWPGEILLKATRQLCKEAGAEELTPYKIDRTLEDVVINDNWGAFWWDESKKRHLTLNPEEWRDKNRKASRPPSKIEYTVGDLSGVYGADSR